MLTTERLLLRRFVATDAAFVLRLLNDPDFLHFIGDRGVRTEDDAQRYLEDGPVASYAEHGFGLLHVGLRAGDTPIGMCGLINRATLADVDLGFAFLPEFRGHGYAFEAARAVLDHAADTLQLPRIVAITSLDNERSGRLLEKLGLRFDSVVTLAGESAASKLFTPDGRGLAGE